MRRLLLVLTLAAAATPAFAQADKPYDIFIGGGGMFPVSSVHDRFNSGGQFQIGGTYFVTPTVGIMFEYDYNKMSGPDKQFVTTSTPIGGTVGTAFIQSNQQIHAVTGSVIVRSHPDSSRMMGVYGIAGGGLYHRVVQLTTPSVGYATVCDPYWYVCYPTAVSVDQIIGDRGSSDFGMNFGAGVTFGHEAKFYVETRYTYVWGPTISTQQVGNIAATNQSSNASYIPLTFGVRF